MKTSNLINSIILASASSILSNFLTLERKEVKDLKAEGDKSVEDLANFSWQQFVYWSLMRR
jgi:hypothetical protein